MGNQHSKIINNSNIITIYNIKYCCYCQKMTIKQHVCKTCKEKILLDNLKCIGFD